MQSSLGSLTFDEKASIENEINNSDITKNSPKETIQNDINIEKSDKTFKIDVSIGSSLTNSGNSVENDGSDDNKIESNHNESETNEKEGNETNQPEIQKDCVIIQVNESKNEDKKQDGEITDILKDQNENFKEIKNQGENSEKNDNLNQNLNSENNLEEEEEKNKKEKRENNLEGDIPTKNEEKKLEENNSKKNVLEVKENNKIEQNTEVIEVKPKILEENIEGQKSGENGKEDNKLKEGDLQITINNNEELNGKKNLKLENNNLNQEIQNNDTDPIKNEENPSQSEETQKQNNTENNENKTPGEIIIEIKGDDLEKEKKIKDKDINTINTNIENDDSDKSEDEEDEELDTSSNDLFNNRKTHYPKGIRNIGLNCYMNSLIQCLFNIEELREYFIKQLNQGKFNKKKQPICYRFAKIMRNLLYSKKAYITPIKFKKEIAKKNPLFGKNKAADATDLFRTLIDSFIFELNTENEEEESEDDDLNDKNKIINKIKKEMKENIIYKYLNVYNLVTYICESPKHGPKNIYSYEVDSNIGFNLENIINKRRKDSSFITLKECFNYTQKVKNNNQFYCNECKTTVIGKSYEKIIVPPEILIIILNRGKGKKIMNKVKFRTVLDLSDFVDNSQNNKNLYYELIGSCNHSGDSSPTGHYTSTCRYNNSFYYFNDIHYQNLTKFEHLGGEPYILFYRRKYFTDNNNGLNNIKISMDLDMNEETLSQEELEKDKYVLTEVINKFYNKRLNIKLYKNNNIFKWKITKDKKEPLIMDFSNPVKNKRYDYDLLSITTIEGTNTFIDDVIDVVIENHYINLDENPDLIFIKIKNFLNEVFKNITGAKCGDLCMII